MDDTRAQLAAAFAHDMLVADIAVIEAHAGHDEESFDETVAILALEHFGRFEALLRCHRDPATARNLFLMMSRRALMEAQDIQEKLDA